jgi:hypothetical protein
MKTLYVFWLVLFSSGLFACCAKQQQEVVRQETLKTDSMKLKITVNQSVFRATLYDNATVTAFIARLPMTINMVDLNGNEKYFDLSGSLPANASNPGTIQKGDLMLYGRNTLVLFYKGFSASYSYTRLGRIENATSLAEVLGSGNATVKFESE